MTNGNGGGEVAAVPSQPSTSLDILERFRKPRPRPGERCEMCGVEIADEHGHVVNLRSQSLLCACRPCYLLFVPGGAAGGNYKAVPDRYVALPPGAMSQGEWEGLQIPVGVAFFFFSSTTQEVHAFYPGPAGATESMLPLDAWDRIRDADPVITTLVPDVEAVLVRAGKAGSEPGTVDAQPACFIVPIDACYELVGHLRRLWRGFDGGAEARQALDDFFTRVSERAEPAPKQNA